MARRALLRFFPRARTVSIGLSLVVSLVATGCDEDPGAAGSSTEAPSPPGKREEGVNAGRITTSEAAKLSAPRNAAAERDRPKTPDGYEIVLPSANAEVEDRQKKIMERAKKRREELVLEPTRPDPEAGDFTLEEAIEGLPIEGDLVAEIHTDLGAIFCDLYADRAPKTVANFIGLVRGKRPFWDPAAGDWVKRPFYDRLTFHRVLPRYLIQAGDMVGDGEGTAGYTLPPESDDTLRQDAAGRLVMANEGDAVSGAQFYILDAPHRELDADDDAHYNVFGQCRPTSVVERIARVPQTGGPLHRPLTRVEIWWARIKRVDGGAANARLSRPTPMPGMDPDEPTRGASPGPSELRMRRQRLLEQQQQNQP